MLVTGGAGFIGSHIVDAYLASGHRVVVLDDLSTGDERRVPDAARLIKADISKAPLGELLRDEAPDTIFHLAAQIDVRKSVADPIRDAEVNVLGTIRLAQAAASAGVRHLVFASTGGAIYGEPEGDAADENHPLNPCSPYGVAKLAGEKYLFALSQGRFKVTVLRCANVYGPRQDGTGEAGVIGIFMNRLLDGKTAIINGDGSQTRDFVHVADVVSVARLVHERGVEGTYNVGTGVETSIATLYELVAEACGIAREPRHFPAKPGEQRRSVLDPARLKGELGFQTFVPLREGLRATAEWFMLHRAQAR